MEVNSALTKRRGGIFGTRKSRRGLCFIGLIGRRSCRKWYGLEFISTLEGGYVNVA